MTRIGQYLQVQDLPRRPGRTTDRWQVLGNGGDVLGVVQWFGRWRQYTFDPAPGTTFNATCLRDIAAWLDKINRERRASR